MRTVLVIATVAGIGQFLGCATSAPTTQPAGPNVVTAPPNSDELPVYDFEEDVLPASVGIEDRNPAPVRRLVVLDPEAPLTPEEQKALGMTKPRYDPLEMYRPAPSIDTPQSPFDHKLNAITYGIGGPGSRALMPVYPTAATTPLHVPSMTWYGPPTGTTGVYPASPATSGVGPSSGVDIGEGPRSRTGSPHARSRP